MAVVVLNSQTRMSLWLAAVLEEKTSSGGIRSREEVKKRKVTNDGGGIIKETASICEYQHHQFQSVVWTDLIRVVAPRHAVPENQSFDAT